MINLSTLAADTMPAAALNANAAGAVPADGAGAFGDVLQQWLGAPPNAGVDLPLDRSLDDQDDEAGDEEDLDELVNANVIDPAAQPIVRLMPAWIAVEAPATPVSASPALGSSGAGVDAPAPVSVNSAMAFDGRMAKAAAAPTDESPIADPPTATAPSAETRAAVPAASPQPTPIATAPSAETPTAVPAASSRPTLIATAPIATAPTATTPSAETPAAVPAASSRPTLIATAPTATALAATAPSAETPAAVPAAGSRPTPNATALVQAMADPATPAATTESQGATVVPTPESGSRDAAPAPAAPRRGAEEHDPARQVSRLTIEAGQRAYAAASDGSNKDTRNGGGEGRHDSRAQIEASAATPSTPTATPFQVVVDRPVPPVAVTIAGAVVVAPGAVEADVATELTAHVVQSIRLQAMGSGGEAIVRLRPDYLGELVVAVKVENGAVSAALRSDTPAVRRWVESNEATLRLALAEHGLQLDRLTISDEAPSTETGAREREDRQEHEDESQPQSRRQRKPAPDATFEVVV